MVFGWQPPFPDGLDPADDLEITWTEVLRADLRDAKGGVPWIGVGQREIMPVEGVDGVDLQLKDHTLPNGNVLDEAEIFR